MDDIPKNAPQHCPGTESSSAGQASACQGCPNRLACASGPKAPDPAIAEIGIKLANVKHKVLVLSGKGGVGKSTFSAHLARGIAADENKQAPFIVSDGGRAGNGKVRRNANNKVVAHLVGFKGKYGGRVFSFVTTLPCVNAHTPKNPSDKVIAYCIGFVKPIIEKQRRLNRGIGVCQVSLLDIDICGPSIPRIMGVDGEQIHQSSSGWSPVYLDDNLSVMSVGFLLSGPDEAVIWRGPKKNGLIKQFLRDVDWGDLDYLIVDTPPGTSDEHLSVVQYLSSAGVDGAIIVTTPQEVSLLDVRKEISFCRKLKLPIIGVVENMSGFICPKCKNESQIFPASTGGAEAMCQKMNVTLLGKLPLDPRIGQCCDEGKNYLSEVSDSPATQAFKDIIHKIQSSCEAWSTESDTGEVTMETS